MFVSLDDDAELVDVAVNERPVMVPSTATVAVALLLSGDACTRRHPVTGEPRGPHCLMGVCYECLITIDGVPGYRACTTSVRAGMSIKTGTNR